MTKRDGPRKGMRVRAAGGHIASSERPGSTAVENDEDPAGAWERWFKINGKGWDDESVDAYIRGRED